jgi:hypothetical protein
MSQGEISADTISENLDEVGAAGLASTFIAAAVTGLSAIGVNFPPLVSGFMALIVGLVFYFLVRQKKKRAEQREDELAVRLRSELSIRLAKLSSVERTDEFDKIRAELIEQPLPESKRKKLERYLVADFEIRVGARDIKAIGAQAVEVHTTNKTNEDLKAQILQLERENEKLRQEVNALKVKSTKVAFDRGYLGSVNNDSLSIEDALEALDHSHRNIVINAVKFLGEEKNAQEIKDDQLIDVISKLKKFTESDYSDLKYASLETIGKIGGREALQFLLFLARSPDEKDVNALIKSLSYLGDIDAADACLTLIYEFDGRDLDDDLRLIEKMGERIDLALCNQEKLVKIIRMAPAEWASPEGSVWKRREFRLYWGVELDDEQRAARLSIIESRVFDLLAKIPLETALGVVYDFLQFDPTPPTDRHYKISLFQALLDMCLSSHEPKSQTEELLYRILSSGVLDIQKLDVSGDIHGESYIPWQPGLKYIQDRICWASALATNLSERLLPYAKEYIQHCITMSNTLPPSGDYGFIAIYHGLGELFASILHLDNQSFEFLFEAANELKVHAQNSRDIDPIFAELEASNLTLSLDFVLNDFIEKLLLIDLNSTNQAESEHFSHLIVQLLNNKAIKETSIETLLGESRQSNGLKKLLIETVLLFREDRISETLIQSIEDELNETSSHTRFYAVWLSDWVLGMEEVSHPPSLVDCYRTILKDETASSLERGLSIGILGEHGNVSDIPSLKKILNSESIDLVSIAILAILTIDIDEGLGIFIPTLEKMNSEKLNEFFQAIDYLFGDISDLDDKEATLMTRLNEALVHCKKKSLSLIGQLRQLSTATTFQDTISLLENLDMEAFIDPVSSTHLKPLSNIQEIDSEQGITFLAHCLEKFSTIPVDKRGGLPALFRTLYDGLKELDSFTIHETYLNPFSLLEVFVHDKLKEQTLQFYKTIFEYPHLFITKYEPHLWLKGVVSKESTQTLLKWLVEEDWDAKAIVMFLIRQHGITQAVKPLLQIVDETFDTIVEDSTSSTAKGCESFIRQMISFFFEIDDVRALNALIKYKQQPSPRCDRWSISVHQTASNAIDSYLSLLVSNLLPPNAKDYLDHMIKEMAQVSLDDNCWPILLIHDLPKSLQFLMKKVLSENSLIITKQVFEILRNRRTDTTFLRLLNDNQMLSEEYFEMLETVSEHDYLMDEEIDENVIETIAILLMNDFETNRLELIKKLHAMLSRRPSQSFIEKLTAYYIRHEEDTINQILVDLLLRVNDTEDRFGSLNNFKKSIVRCLRQAGETGVVGILEDMLNDGGLDYGVRFEVHAALIELNPGISRFDELASEILLDDFFAPNIDFLELMLKVDKERTRDWLEEFFTSSHDGTAGWGSILNFVIGNMIESNELGFTYDKLHQFDRGNFLFAEALALTKDSRAVDYLATGVESDQWVCVMRGLLRIGTKEAKSILVAMYVNAIKSGAVTKAKEIGEYLAYIFKDATAKDLLLEVLLEPSVNKWGRSLYALLSLEDESTISHIDAALSPLNKLPHWNKMQVVEDLSSGWVGFRALGSFDEINPDFVRKLELSELFASFIPSKEN